MRLINADNFKTFLQALVDTGAPYKDVIELLNNEPTVDSDDILSYQYCEADENHQSSFNIDRCPVGNSWCKSTCKYFKEN